MAIKALVIATIYSRLTSIQEALGERGWQVHAFQNPKEALDNLQSNRYHAVFCDINLRGASAAGFLAWTRRLSNDVPFYLIGQLEDSRVTRDQEGVTGFLTFPLKPAELPLPTGLTSSGPLVAQEKKEVTQTPLSGNTSLIAISDLLDMMGIANQSGIIELGKDGQEGRIHVRDGILLHAETVSKHQQANGLPALATLMLLEESDFRVFPYAPPERPTVNLPAATAMTEAARLADETRRYQQLISDVKAHCPAVYDAATGYLLADKPNQGQGNAVELFQLARDLLERNRHGLNAKPSELLVVYGQNAVMLQRFGDDNVLVARAPAARRARLYQAVRLALQNQQSS